MFSFIDLFAGIGGFRLGLERVGWKCVWSNDWDKYACAVYRRNFGEILEADVRMVDPKDISDADMVVGGFPCQPFSYAGKKLGFQDSRGTLFFEIIRILKKKRPQLVLLENVKGLLSAQGGECFAAVIKGLRELGYATEWAVLDSQDFGVPQHRERVFIVGYLGEQPSEKVFAELGAGKSTYKFKLQYAQTGSGQCMQDLSCF